MPNKWSPEDSSRFHSIETRWKLGKPIARADGSIYRPPWREEHKALYLPAEPERPQVCIPVEQQFQPLKLRFNHWDKPRRQARKLRRPREMVP